MEIAVKIANIASRAYRVGGVFSLIAFVLPKLNRILFSCDIPPCVFIPKTTILCHQGLGVVIHPNAIIGDHVMIRQHVSIGNNGKNNQRGLAPRIGNYVTISAGACVLGDITIGNNVTIGANAVVINDVPDNCVVVGIPAKIIKRILGKV